MGIHVGFVSDTETSFSARSSVSASQLSIHQYSGNG